MNLTKYQGKTPQTQPSPDYISTSANATTDANRSESQRKYNNLQNQTRHNYKRHLNRKELRLPSEIP